VKPLVAILLLLLGVSSLDTANASKAPADPLEPAKAAIRLKDYARAAGELQGPAAAGDADAQYLLATLLLNGLGSAADVEGARGWLEKAAAQGHARAAFSLSALLAESSPPDLAGARRWLERAQQLGLAQAQQAQSRAALPLEFRPQVDLTDPAAKRDALWLAAEQGDMAVVQALSEPSLVEAHDEFGRGALARAAQAGQAEAAALLIRKGAKIGTVDMFQMTPLMLAAQSGSRSTVDAILAAGAATEAADERAIHR
jgi:hypothetical protein